MEGWFSSVTSKLSFPVRSMSLLSRPDRLPPSHGAQRRGWEEQSHAQYREHGAPDLPHSEHRGKLTAAGSHPALAVLALFEGKRSLTPTLHPVRTV